MTRKLPNTLFLGLLSRMVLGWARNVAMVARLLCPPVHTQLLPRPSVCFPTWLSPRRPANQRPRPAGRSNGSAAGSTAQERKAVLAAQGQEGIILCLLSPAASSSTPAAGSDSSKHSGPGSPTSHLTPAPLSTARQARLDH